MLPLQQAYEAKDAIIEYLKATFNFKDKEVNDAFYAFIQNDEYGIAHEPYISLKTAQGGLSVAGRCRCLTKDSNTSIEKEGYIPYSLQA